MKKFQLGFSNNGKNECFGDNSKTVTSKITKAQFSTLPCIGTKEKIFDADNP